MMVKSNPNAPQLTVTPTSLDFGTTNSSKTLLLKNTGTGVLNWTANTNDAWIVISANSGSTTGGNASSLTVTINKSGLTANNYTGTILLNSNGGSQVVNVAMTVQQGTLDPPTLQLIGNPTKTSIPLGWTKVNDTNFDNYMLYRSVASNVDESGTLVTTITNSDQNTLTDDGLNSGTVYYYKVYVYSKTGIGSASNEVSATTSRSVSSWVSTETISSLSDGIWPNSMDVISENDIWLTGKDEIWHYNGSTWSKSFTATDNGDFTGISFINPNKGYAILNYYFSSELYDYNGISWSKVSNLTISYPQDIIAFSESNVWILGYGEVYHFDGSNWTTTTLDIGSGVDLDAISANDIWALGKGGDVFHYNGVGWAFVEDMSQNDRSYAISAISDNDVWTTNYGNGGLRHYNGVQFDLRYLLSDGDPDYKSRYAIKMISSNEGWSSSQYALSYFDGNSWQDVANPVSSSVMCIEFLTRNKGWAVTNNGTILRYVE